MLSVSHDGFVIRIPTIPMEGLSLMRAVISRLNHYLPVTAHEVGSVVVVITGMGTSQSRPVHPK